MKNKNLIAGLLAACLSSIQYVVAAEDISFYSKRDLNQDVRISTEGTYLAVHVDQQGKDALAILHTDTLEPINMIRFSQNRQPGQFHWVNDKRIMFRLEEVESWFDAGHWGEWLSQDMDGKRSDQIFSYRGADNQTGSHIKKRENVDSAAFLEDRLRSDPKNVLMALLPLGRGGLTELVELDVYLGTYEKSKFSPVRNPDYTTDRSERPRFVTGYQDKDVIETYYWDLSAADARLYASGSIAGGFLSAIGFKEANEVYIEDDRKSDTREVFLVDLDNGKETSVFRHDRVSPTSYHFDEETQLAYAIEYEVAKPAYHYLEPENKTARVLKGLSRAFDGRHVQIVSQTDDGNLNIVYVYSDIDPGAYYLYNRDTRQASYLLSRRPWVEEEAYTRRKTLTIQARDDLPVQAHLTTPAKRGEEVLPVVVLVPPNLVRQRWAYDPLVQLLVDRGYAVLQVDTRGTPGYGKRHEALGMHGWGDEVPADIIDAVNAVTENGLVGDTACIYGERLGAYLALRASVMSPQSFDCVIAVGGIYDMEELYRTVSIPWHYDRTDFVDAVKEDKARLQAASLLDAEVSVPALVFYGDANLDPHTSSTSRLRKNLKKSRQQSSEKMKRNKSGFYGEESRTRIYSQMVKFLKSHL